MSDGPIHQPHDKIFKAVFSEPPTAAAFLQNHLPLALVRIFHWKSLTLVSGSFVSKHLRSLESDLLYSVKLRNHPEDAFVYILFEHQSQKDHWIALRLLEYMLAVWKRFRTNHPKSRHLPVILPVVLAQNRSSWKLSTRFSSLFNLHTPAEALESYIPDYEFRLLELAGMPFNKIVSTPLGILTLRVLKAERSGELLHDAVWDEPLLSSLEVSWVERLLRYIFEVGKIDREDLLRKVEGISAETMRSTAMTLAQRLHQEGRQEGLQVGALVGKIQLCQQILGLEVSLAEELAMRPQADLMALHRKLQEVFQKKLR